MFLQPTHAMIISTSTFHSDRTGGRHYAWDATTATCAPQNTIATPGYRTEFVSSALHLAASVSRAQPGLHLCREPRAEQT